MESSIRQTQVIDAAVALAVVLGFQTTYCGLKYLGKLHVADRHQLQILTIVGGFFGVCGITFVVLFNVFQSQGHKPICAYSMLASCQGTAVLSIWIFEVWLILHAPDYH